MLRPTLALAAALAALGTPSLAMVPEGSCAIIVAARTSVAEVELFERQNPQLNVTAVYEASNGWYAISIGEVALPLSEQRLSALKNSGTVPPDSYCSTGKSYLREVRSAPAQSGGVREIADTALVAPFDARPMSLEEKRFLQSALAYAGYYAGLLDGSWGQGSQQALDAFAFKTWGSEASNGDAAYLMMQALEQYQRERWQYRHYSQYGLSIFLPTASLQVDGSDGAGLALDDPMSGISVYITRAIAADTAGFHQRFEAQHDRTTELYRVRDADRWVTAATWEGEARYLRSELWSADWASVFVSAPPAPFSPINLVVGSITRDRTASIALPVGGYAQRQIAAVAQAMAQASAVPQPSTAPVSPVPIMPANPAPPPAPLPASTTPPAPPSPSAPDVMSSGTAFYVDADGHALTNAHVIEGCRLVTLAGLPAELLAVSQQNDLAVLGPTASEGAVSYLTFETSAAALNSDVTVAGFPLQPDLANLNVTRGAVSSLSGMGGDITRMQITAPVQPGNSGGPVVNRDGRVVGVVVSKIDLEYALQAYGSVPENINFAIRSDIAKLFLTAHGFSFAEASGPRDLTPEAIAAELQDATVLVECLD